MKIIPVLDLLNGEVVRGTGGDRQNYQAIHSPLVSSSHPADVLEAFLSLHPFDTVYVADLNALQNSGDSRDVVTSLLEQFSTVQFWIDGGFQAAADMLRYAAYSNASPIIASESLKNLTHYRQLQRSVSSAETILSLDHNAGYLGPHELFESSDYWPRDIIVMALEQVGQNRGPSLELIAKYQAQGSEANFYAAGGVRNNHDIQVLAERGVAGALVSSALHSGALDIKLL
ncbi:MAG: HisA/HisF-related TIM barrel protein [Pseudomonadota bacterium]